MTVRAHFERTPAGGRWVIDEDVAEAAPTQDLSGLSKAGLVELAKGFGLASSGSKPALVARLQEHIDALDGGSQVESVAFVDEGSSDGEQLDVGQPGADALDEDADAFGHGD